MESSPLVWRPVSPADAPAVAALLARTDGDWGNVVERSAVEVRQLVATAHGCVREDNGTADAVALFVPGDEVVMCVDRGVDDRHGVLEEACSFVDLELAVGTPLWLQTADHMAAAVARNHRLTPAYTDLQMRTSTPSASGVPADLAPGDRWRVMSRLTSSVADEVHDLVCAAWGVAAHREAFRTRFERKDTDPRLWVLLDRDGGPTGLAAAALGKVQELADGRFGVVTHLDVHPQARRLGLGTAALHELLRRFRELGLEEAQLGVHDDNASGAPKMYRSLGWRVVSSQTKWVRPTSASVRAAWSRDPLSTCPGTEQET